VVRPEQFWISTFFIKRTVRVVTERTEQRRIDRVERSGLLGHRRRCGYSQYRLGGSPRYQMTPFAQSKGGCSRTNRSMCWSMEFGMGASRCSARRPPPYAAHWRSAAWSHRVCDLLRFLPWTRWSGRQRRKLHRECRVSRVSERSISANHGHRGPAGIGRAGLERQRERTAHDLRRNFRRGRMARVPSAIPKEHLKMTPENQPTRRGMLMRIGILCNGLWRPFWQCRWFDFCCPPSRVERV